MHDSTKLHQYLAAWDLSNPHLLTQTFTGHIYTVTRGAETVILKLLAASATEEQRGALALRYFDGHGAVRLLRSDDGAQLLEYAPGDELVTLVERGVDLEELVVATLLDIDQIRDLDDLLQLREAFAGPEVLLDL